MANKEHLKIIKQGVYAWNEWRKNNPDIDLSEANLVGVDLSMANLIGVNLRGADLRFASLCGADLSMADFNGADLGGADLFGTNLMGADLRRTYLGGTFFTGANFQGADLSEAKLINADLTRANLVETNFEKANLTGCRIYGISAWNLKLQGAIQSDLIITPMNEPTITLDNLEVAQFVYLLLENEKLRDVIDTITSKVVLILGRFTNERKAILDEIKKELRNRNYLPILFDFEKPRSKNMTETITLLAGMARFIIADITDAKSIPQELQAIVPHLPSVPVQPLLESSQKEYGMFEPFRSYPWVLEIYYYESIQEILASLNEKIINPAEEKVQQLRKIN